MLTSENDEISYGNDKLRSKAVSFDTKTISLVINRSTIDRFSVNVVQRFSI